MDNVAMDVCCRVPDQEHDTFSDNWKSLMFTGSTPHGELNHLDLLDRQHSRAQARQDVLDM